MNKKRGKKNLRKKDKKNKLNLFQRSGVKLFGPCPLSGKNEPIVDLFLVHPVAQDQVSLGDGPEKPLFQ